MKIRVIKLGRIAYAEIRTLAGIYEARLAPLAKVEGLELKETAEVVLPQPAAQHPVIALDEHGALISSREMAADLTRLRGDPAVKSVTFLVGGPQGLSPELKSHAQRLLSLSRATFTSDLAWLLLWEQLYRAHSIMKGTGYHHE